MNTTKRTGEFNIPPQTREPWERIVNRRGSLEDLQAVLGFLAKAWEYDAADPRGFQRWLSDHGLDLEDVAPSVFAESKAAYHLDLNSRTAPTKEVAEALINGPHASEFFTSIGRYSSDFRILAYETAVSTYQNEGIAFALAALSQESQWIIDATTKSLPDSPILKAFTSFIVLKSTRACLGLMPDRSSVACDNLIPIDRLFCLATNPPKTTAEEITRLGEGEKTKLIRMGETLVDGLPERGFGQFARVNVSLFVCNAGPESRLFGTAKELLVSTGEPAVADFLELLGPDYVKAELLNANTAIQPDRERYVAALIDAWRRLSDDSIRKFEQETTSIKSKVPVIAIALSAGTAAKSPQHEARFERLLVRGIQSAKGQPIREWLLRNPQFIKYLPVSRASLQTVKTILDVARSVPAQALAVSSQLLEEVREATPLEYWEEAIRTLAGIGESDADKIFRKFVIERVRAGESSYVHDLLSREPAASLLRRNFVALLDSAAEPEWSTLFEILRRRNTESTLIQIVDAVFARGGKLSQWIVSVLVPDLLESDSISPDFHRRLTNGGMTSAIAKALSGRVFGYIEELRTFKDTWTTKRTEIKANLLSRVRAGLRIALNTTVPDTRLHAQYSKAIKAVEAWATAPPPVLDPLIVSAASTEPASILVDEHSLLGVFAHRVPSAIEFTLTVARNPWIVDVILRQQRGPWPKAEVLVGQIIDRYVHVSQIRRRSQQQLDTLGDNVRVELALAVRELLSDIESEVAGYFAFRDIFDQNGLHPVMDKLGAPVDQRNLSSEKHKIVRDPGVRGRMRVFGLGIKINDKVVSSALVMNSGDDDDRD